MLGTPKKTYQNYERKKRKASLEIYANSHIITTYR